MSGFKPFGEAEAAAPATLSPNVYVSIAPSGEVTIVAHRSEMGTGIRTTLPMVLADELEADWRRVKIVQATGDAKYGDQNTDGSRSVRHFYRPMRQAGAAARQMLEAAAAQSWKVRASECQARNHEVVHGPTGRKLGFGALVAAAAKLPVPAGNALRLKAANARRYVGTAVPIVDLNDIVVGKATYGIDIVLPGMKHASIERCPVYGGRTRSVDTAEALRCPASSGRRNRRRRRSPSGFLPLGGVAVIASNSWAAQQGRQKLKIDWDLGPNASYDSTAYRAELEATARRPGGSCAMKAMSMRRWLRAAQRVTADYYVPHLAHAPMEPLAAVARMVEGRCEVWTSTQNPQAARTTVAQVLKLDGGGRDHQCHAAGRRLRPQVEAGLMSPRPRCWRRRSARRSR